jgi:hypothetical protein
MLTQGVHSRLDPFSGENGDSKCLYWLLNIDQLRAHRAGLEFIDQHEPSA